MFLFLHSYLILMKALIGYYCLTFFKRKHVQRDNANHKIFHIEKQGKDFILDLYDFKSYVCVLFALLNYPSFY